MNDYTLPGDIPGLLRCGSPVLYLGQQRTCTDTPTNQYVVVTGHTMTDEGPPWGEPHIAHVQLDMTHPTGGAHAAWWLLAKQDGDVDRAAHAAGVRGIWKHINDAVYARPFDVDAVCQVILHMAGRAVA